MFETEKKPLDLEDNIAKINDKRRKETSNRSDSIVNNEMVNENKGLRKFLKENNNNNTLENVSSSKFEKERTEKKMKKRNYM